MSAAASLRIVNDTRLQGLQTLSRRFARDQRRVLVGVPEGKAEADGTSIASIAAIHEFGSPENGIPERSFLRGGIVDSLDKITALNIDHIRRIAGGGFTVAVALQRLGAFAAGAVQQFITQGNFTPNAPSTIARKRSSKPLIDTGSLRASITYQIVNENEVT